MMKFLILDLKVDLNNVNETIKDLTPFRYSLRVIYDIYQIGRYNILDLLIKKGAYIVFDDKSVNNMIISENGTYKVIII